MIFYVIPNCSEERQDTRRPFKRSVQLSKLLKARKRARDSGDKKKAAKAWKVFQKASSRWGVFGNTGPKRKRNNLDIL